MRVSVIMPLYNQAPVAVEAVRSALAQTFPPMEVIVADDGSTDGGGERVGGLDPRVQVLRQENRGPAAARNLAARAARGDWLAFLDADDLWLPRKLERQRAEAEAHPGAVLIHADGYVIDAVDAPLPATTFFTDRVPPAGPDAVHAMFHSPLLTPAVMVRRDAFERVGGFNEKRRLHEDMELFFRLAAGGAEFAYAAEPLVVVRMVVRRRDQFEYMTASTELQEELRHQFPDYANKIGRGLSANYRMLGIVFLSRGDTASARASFVRSLRIRGINRFDLVALGLLLTGQGRRLLDRNRATLAKLEGGSTVTPGD